MSRFKWACPTCGAATHSKEALVRSSEKSCSCDSALWVASDMPRCVAKLQEEIAALRVEDAKRDAWYQESAAQFAALEKVAEVAARHGNDDRELDEALREAGYLGGVE